MEIIEKEINGVFEIQLHPHIDERGYFMRTFDDKEFYKYGLNRVWVQENHSKSKQRGIIRGLHFQFQPYTETKLIRCIRGKVLDVYVDLRKDSSSFGDWGSTYLSESKKSMLYIPRGFAHGFCTITKMSEVVYKVDNYYSPEHEGGILWNDDDLNIFWDVEEPILSEKDTNNMTFKEFKKRYKGITI